MAPSHHLIQCWYVALTNICVTRLKWVNESDGVPFAQCFNGSDVITRWPQCHYKMGTHFVKKITTPLEHTQVQSTTAYNTYLKRHYILDAATLKTEFLMHCLKWPLVLKCALTWTNLHISTLNTTQIQPVASLIHFRHDVLDSLWKNDAISWHISGSTLYLK